MFVREELPGAPPLSLNAQISATREYEVARFALADLKALREGAGATVNDVVLTLATGALRRLLQHRGEELPRRGIRAQVPVNLRGGDGTGALGNRVTSVYVDLPVATADPLDRLRVVHHRMEALKRSSQPLAGEALTDSAGTMPPALGAALARLMYSNGRLFNLTITNVPGPQEPLAAFGSPLHEVLPLVGLFAGHGLAIAVFSYAGRLVFGVNGDRAICPDVDVVADGLRESFAELRAAVRGGQAAAFTEATKPRTSAAGSA
jgi:WS/DGAT/MGAT family acyltransferase